MTPIPFTNETQQLLTALGFKCTHHEASWRDVGGPENGPKLVGHNEYDEWSKDDTSVYVQAGAIQDVEKMAPEPINTPSK